MRVLYLIDTLNVGGTEQQMASAALHLQRGGHRVVVGCLREEGPLLETLRDAGVPVVVFPKGKTLLSLNGLYQLARLVSFLIRHKFQVLHAYDLWANLLGVPAARLAGIPVVISSRRYLADLEWYTPWRNRILRFIYRLSTCVIVNSRAIREKLVDQDRVAPEKLRIIYNAVDVSRFASAHEARERALPNINASSRLIAVLANMYSRVKGHACLISAAQIVCDREPEAVFLLVGDGPERSRLETLVKDAWLHKNIVFAGRRTDTPEVLACCDLSVLPSEAEGFPNALLESMSAGLPVVATAVGGTKEIIENGVNGLLVPPGDPEALAAAILRLLQEPEIAMNMALAGQRDVRRLFSFDRLIADLEQLYRENLHSRWHASAAASK